MEFKDREGTPVMQDDVIELHQTVNGHSEFYIKSLQPLDVRYNYNRNRIYEYDMIDLLSPSRFTSETEYEILNPF